MAAQSKVHVVRGALMHLKINSLLTLTHREPDVGPAAQLALQ